MHSQCLMCKYSFGRKCRKNNERIPDDIYNNLERTCNVLEGFINVISKLLKDYKERMELKFNKKIIVMNIIKKVYETYYNDFEDCKKGIKNINILKYLCKPYSEFSEINFYSDLDKITDSIEEIKNTVENTEISSVARFSYYSGVFTYMRQFLQSNSRGKMFSPLRI